MKFRASVLTAAALILGLTCSCDRPEVTGASEVAGSSLKVLPKESVGLVVFDVGAFRDLELVRRWFEDLTARVGEEGIVHEVQQALGPRVLEGLDRLALAILPVSGDTMGYALLAQGAFDEDELRRTMGGEDILTLIEVGGQPDLSVTVLRGGDIALGTRAILQVVRDNAAGRGAGLAANERLMALLAKVRPPSHAWGVIDYAPMARLVRQAVERHGPRTMAVPGTAAVRALEAVAFQGTIQAQGVTFDLTGQASGEEEARQLADAARGLTSLGRLAVSRDEARGWFEILDGIRIDQAGTEVKVHGAIPQSAFDGLAGDLRPAAPRAPGSGGEGR